jgi:hypothetical protein
MLFACSLYLFFFIFLKLMAYFVEGRRSGSSRTGSRPSHRQYEKLRNVTDVIHIDDTDPVSNDEVVILKT